MTKWFDTNYHYIVPELDIAGQVFTLDASNNSKTPTKRRALGVEARPVHPRPLRSCSRSPPAGASNALYASQLPAPPLPIYEESFSPPLVSGE